MFIKALNITFLFDYYLSHIRKDSKEALNFTFIKKITLEILKLG